ncbi:MAG TPA: PKD domain-containing protein, partial [Gemmatimonadales bacterium]|nr:PKD domain-containing protein [Gemmatimonadales bacterium]
MRSIRLLAATSFILLALGACGDDGGGVGPDQNPVAGFTVVPCTVGVACPFTDTSSDPQGANTITTRSWDFNGDGTEDLGGNVVAPTFTYTTAGTFQAKLTVTDNSGNTDDAIVPVTVSGGTTNVPPVASFAIPACTVNADCAFTSTSTDQDGDIALATHSWNFGDGSPAVTG